MPTDSWRAPSQPDICYAFLKECAKLGAIGSTPEPTMRRHVFPRLALLLATAALLGGCATSDRFSYGRQDPFIWFLSGMPAPYDLNWPKNDVPELPVLNPPDYTPIAPMQPLDYPRGWNPDNPPLTPLDAGSNTPADAPADATPQPARCNDSCDARPALHDAPADTARTDAGEHARGAIAQR